jgi:hypothetical protein
MPSVSGFLDYFVLLGEVPLSLRRNRVKFVP